MVEELMPLEEAKRITREAAEEPIPRRREAELEGVELKVQPLGPAGWSGVVVPKLVFPAMVGDRALLRWIDITPIKHFEVKRSTFIGITYDLDGKLQVGIRNPTPFQRDCEFKCRAVGDGFEFVDTTIKFTIRRRANNIINYKWHLGFFDILVRAFISLFSSETRIHGYVKVGNLKKDYDVTDEIPIEKA